MENKILIDFNYYKTFYYVAKCGNFSLAAKELGVSQPAVSYNISELEKSLDAQLFIRAGKKIELTRNGELLLDYVNDCFNTLVLAENKILKFNNSTQVRIGIQSYIMRALSHFHRVIEKYSDYNILFYDSTAEDLIKKVQLKEFDFAIINGDKTNTGLSCIKIGDLNMGFVIHKDNIKRFSVKDHIEKYKFALPLSTTKLRKELDRRLLQKNISISSSFEFNSNQICLSLLNHLDCIFFMPLEFVKKEIDKGEFVVVDLGIDNITTPISIVYNEKYTNAAVSQIINSVIQSNL